VILSGTGKDGALGIEAIKAEGGITFAQAEASAQYPGMPHSAIATGSVDSILPPADIAQALRDLTTHTYLRAESADALPAVLPVFDQILALLKTACGTDFRLYRQTSLKRRLLRRMALHRLDTLEEYLSRLEHDPAEVQALYQDILIKVTAFFRDHEVFTALQTTVFSQLLQGRPRDTPIRIWVPGCATGEEVYSLAICFLEFLEARGQQWPLQLFGTDVNEEAVARARAGLYIENIAADVSPERLRRFFAPEGKSYRISKALRELCVFARQDIIQDPPFSNLDLVSCRNVLIYMEPELQTRLLSVFHYALKPTGLLILGTSESANAAGALFTAYDAKHKIYTKQFTTPALSPHFTARGRNPVVVGVPPPPRGRQTPESKAVNVQQQADHLILDTYAPPSVMLNRECEIVHFRGDTSPFLVPAPGKASFHILKMAREGVLAALSTALTQAKREGEPVVKPGLQVVHTGSVYHFTLRVLPFTATAGDRYFLVCFEPTPAPAPTPHAARRSSHPQPAADTLVRENERLRKELQTTREYLQTLIEEREAANEELQAAHEASLSANEELQSINEEMETAKEELQSSNEELTTLNEELGSRNADLAHVSNDLTNLLTVINIPIVMVDRGLRIRRFTPAAGTLLNLLPGDLGRPLTDLRLGMPVPDFGQLVGEVIDTLTVVQRDIQVQDHQWYTLSIRPYQTVDNQIDGAVITFVDISPVKGSELRYRQLYEQGFTTTSDAIAQVDVETGYIQEVNPSFLRLLGWPREEVVGKPLWEGPVFHAIAESETAFRALSRVGYRRFEDLSLPTKEGRRVAVDLVSTLYPAGTKEVVQLRLHDLTERKRVEEALRTANRALVRTNEDLRQFAYSASHDLREPLRQISVYIQLLATTYEGQLDATARQYFDTCLQGAQRMQLLVHDLLAYVRISEAQGDPPLTDTNHVLRQTLENLQAAIAESGGRDHGRPLTAPPRPRGASPAAFAKPPQQRREVSQRGRAPDPYLRRPTCGHMGMERQG
jgi:two-component system CheB/CheR fusion protein